MFQQKNKLAILCDRAKMLAKTRAFFEERGVIEVDTPLLSPFAPSTDPHIDLITTQEGFLITSPELAMKRLVAEGLTEIYQLSHAFRRGEKSPRHRHEFMMVEWYRAALSERAFLEEVKELIFLFVPSRPLLFIPYRDLWKIYLGLDYETLCLSKVKDYLPPEGGDWELGTALDFLFATAIEPHLGKESLTFITDFPPQMAALARLREGSLPPSAIRFELYIDGLELGNGYHELSDAKEQRRRFNLDLDERARLGKITPPLDEAFLSAVNNLPENLFGIAVGFDRLMMLRHKTKEIAKILP